MRNLTSKYHAKKAVYNGIKFDSKKEMNYFIKLKALESNKTIWNLELQKKYELQPKYKINNRTVRSIYYTADFVYEDSDGIHVVDVKGYKTDVYKLKKKLFEYKYNIEIEEI